jgi:hypothetical protein
MGIELQGVGGERCRRGHSRTAGACGITHLPRKATGGKLCRALGPPAEAHIWGLGGGSWDIDR